MKTRRDRWIRTQAHRGEMPQISPPAGALDRRFLRELSDFDKELELYWHPTGQRWVLYRRVGRSAGRSANDLMIKEAVVEGPRGEYRRPGPWLLERLRKWDKTKGGAVDPQRANYLFRKQLQRSDEEAEAIQERKRLQLSESLAEDFMFCGFGRSSIVANWEPER